MHIALIAANDEVAQGFDCMIGNDPNMFQTNGTGKPNRRAGDLLDNCGSGEFKISHSKESLNLDLIRIMVTPY